MGGVLDGKVALVTGASSGIGEAAALVLAAAGADVAVSARRAERLAGLAARIEAEGRRALSLPGDVADEAFAESMVADTVAKLGRIDILVNSAGILHTGGVEKAVTSEWRHVMDVNFFGTLYPCRAVIPYMRAQGGGDIVNVSSTSGRRIAPQLGGYAPSKHALNAMSYGLRNEVGAYGIRICVLEPGGTATEVAEALGDSPVRDQVRTHLAKEGTMMPKDIADGILFVVSLPPRANVQELLIRPTNDLAAM